MNVCKLFLYYEMCMGDDHTSENTGWKRSQIGFLPLRPLAHTCLYLIPLSLSLLFPHTLYYIQIYTYPPTGTSPYGAYKQ